MVFENLTLFEFRLEDAQFGPRSLGRGDATDETEASETASGGRGRLAALVVLTLVAAGLAVVWRRARSDTGSLAVEDVDEADLEAAN